jgi:nucleoside-diphosphate-sugar epimerase
MTAPPLFRDDLDHVLAHTEAVWDDLEGATILFTGGTGFIGRWMLATFLHAHDTYGLNARAIILSRRPEQLAQTTTGLAGHPAVELARADVREPLPPLACTHVVHLATETNVDLSHPSASAYFDASVDGTRNVLDLARAAESRKFLFVSSGAVYGRQPAELERLTEDYPGAPAPEDVSNAYGHGKRAAEFLCAAASSEVPLEAKIARCFAFVGPYLNLDSGFAIGNFIRDALWRGRIEVTGDGTPLRSYLYAADLAIWLWTILTRGTAARPYNVGSDRAVDVRTLATRVAQLADTGASVHVAGEPGAAGPRARYVPDTTRARDELGLETWIDLDSAIERTLRWAASAAGPEGVR